MTFHIVAESKNDSFATKLLKALIYELYKASIKTEKLEPSKSKSVNLVERENL